MKRLEDYFLMFAVSLMVFVENSRILGNFLFSES